jgi:mono/diheme cytochrome c family protein
MSSNNMKAKVKRQKVKVGRRELKRVSFCLFTFAFCLTFGGCRQDMQDQPRYEVYESSGFFKDGLSSRKPVEGTVARGYLRADSQLYTGKMDKAQAMNANTGAGGGSNSNRAGAMQGGEESSSATASTTGGEGGEQAGAASSASSAQGNSNGGGNTNTQRGANGQGAGDAKAGEDDDADTFPFPVTAEVVARGRERFEIYCTMCHGYTGEGDGMIVRRGYRKPPSYHEDRLRQARVGYFFRVMTEGFGAMPPYRAQVPVQDRWAIAAYIRALQLSRLNQQAAPAHGGGNSGEDGTGGHR